MIDRIAHYPPLLHDPIKRILDNPCFEGNRLIRKGRRLFSIDASASLSKGEIYREGVVWVGAITGPCVIMAMTVRDANRELESAKVKHFSTLLGSPEIDRFLYEEGGVAGNSRVWVSGLAQKSGRETLDATATRIADRIRAFGIPVSLEWAAADQPQLFDARNGQLISDFGLGLLNSIPPTHVQRFHVLGFTATHWAMANIAL